jgi:hypothetical protein
MVGVFISGVCICLMLVFVRLAMTPVTSVLFSKMCFATDKRRTKRKVLPKMTSMMTLMNTVIPNLTTPKTAM